MLTTFLQKLIIAGYFFYFVLFFIREERKALLTNERFKHLDETEIASTRAEKECFLHLAVR